MAQARTRREPGVPQREFYTLQEHVHLEVQLGQRHFTTNDLAESLDLSPDDVRAGMAILRDVNPFVGDAGVDKWIITKE